MWAAVTAGMALAGCGGSSGTSRVAPTPHPTKGVSPAASATSSPHVSPPPPASPSATPLAPPALPATCRVPVAGSGVGHQSGVNNRFLAGFIDVGTGAEAVDPSGEMVAGASGDNRWHSVATPILYGDTAQATYGAVAGRWVPVAPGDLAPDGLRYAYTEIVNTANGPPTSRIHLVDIGAAADRVLLDTDRGAYDVLAFTGEGIYVVHHLPGADASDGLWLLDPGTGSLRQIRASEQRVSWTWIHGHAAWAEVPNPADPSPPSFSKGGFDEVMRLDLATGAVATWFYSPGQAVSIAGFDTQEHPLVRVAFSDQSARLYSVASASAAAQIVPGSGTASDVVSAYTGRYGTWLSTLQSLYLERADQGMQQITTAPGVINVNVRIAGDCPTRP